MGLLRLLGISGKERHPTKEEVVQNITDGLDVIIIPYLKKNSDGRFEESLGHIRRVNPGFWPSEEQELDGQNYFDWVLMYETRVNGEIEPTSSHELKLTYVSEPEEQKGFRINEYYGPGKLTLEQALAQYRAKVKEAYNHFRGFSSHEHREEL